MKKFLIATLLICILSGKSYGAVSGDTEIYVRKDVFEARMDRMEALIDKAVIEIKSEIRELKVIIDEMDKRISIISNVVYWIFALVSVILASLALTPIVREFRRPQITLEDVKQVVKKLIEENNARLQVQ